METVLMTPRKPLGPNQLKWLDENIHNFRTMREQAELAHRQSEETRKRAGLAP
jgi:hypothetical protein